MFKNDLLDTIKREALVKVSKSWTWGGGRDTADEVLLIGASKQRRLEAPAGLQLGPPAQCLESSLSHVALGVP